MSSIVDASKTGKKNYSSIFFSSFDASKLMTSLEVLNTIYDYY